MSDHLAEARIQPHKKGDRVRRRKDVFNDESPYLYGTITKRYSEQYNIGFYDELYEVKWDIPKILPGGTILEREKGFLRHGLEKVE